MANIDPIALAQALIRCRSVTPRDRGAIAIVAGELERLGFTCHCLRFETPGTAPIKNLYARYGDAAPNFCFAGHTDVVPPGDASLWQSDPFAAEMREGLLYGRGAADMKSAIAAFTAAAEQTLAKGNVRGSISLLITGDEEGPNINGTRRVLEWLTEKGERIDHCLVGEPTAQTTPGDTIKIGRRGSMRVEFTVRGRQGHTAYPHRALNPIPVLAKLVTTLANEPLDSGTAHFEPSTLAFTTFDVGNNAGNVSPAEARAACNIRFNDLHTPDNILERIDSRARALAMVSGAEIAVTANVGGTAFVTEPGAFTDLLSRAIERVTGSAPLLSTTGGTSDARFIKDHCPVAEVGLAGATMHQVNECVPVADIHRLTEIYASILQDYFGAPPAAAVKA
ncbi:MAG: succinyl-diaminopimelate desuccinylase [Alphaproteobacteria bacterium]|nr:succinyl-diaminopimelate desuccinylase [Alphaproteobacteria bacterium]